MADDIKKTWVRFKTSGVAHGYGHLAGDVTELTEKEAETLTELGCTVPAKVDEIKVAKVVIAAELAAAKPTIATTVASADLAAQMSAMLQQNAEMQKQIADLQAAAKPAELPAPSGK